MTSQHAAGAVAGSIIASPAGLYGADPVALILRRLINLYKQRTNYLEFIL